MALPENLTNAILDSIGEGLFTVDKDLKKALKKGTFREDRYYRRNVIPIEVPPLRGIKILSRAVNCHQPFDKIFPVMIHS